MTSIIAVIPARGGSKGIPDKNLRMIGGLSLLGRTIRTANKSAFVTEVLVSSDSVRILDEARRHGASALERPADLASDTASSEAALIHALERRPRTDVLVFLQCTSPFLTTAELDRTISAVVEGGADTAFTAVPFHGFVWVRQPDGDTIGVNHDSSVRLRRQDRRPEYLESGAAYVMRADGFRRSQHRFFGRSVAVEVDSRRSMEIDVPEDLDLARALAAVLDAEPRPLDLRVPKLVALDFDGVFTDNRVQVDQHGVETVTCHRGDGHGLSLLQEVVPVVVLSTERNPVVAARCEKLGLPYEQGLGDTKLEALLRYASGIGVALTDVLFVGNDTNDLACMRAVGTAIAVADAVPEVRSVAHAVLSRKGGDGALREVSDAILMATQAGGPR